MAQTNWEDARGAREVSRNLKDGDDRMGAKIKTPQKSLGFPTKIQEIPGQKFPSPPPKKNSHAKFPSLLDSNSTRDTQEHILFHQ